MTTTMANDDKVAAPSTLEITSRIARYAYDRLVFAGPVSAAAVGTATVWSIGAMEASLFLMPQPRSAWQVQARFVSRYAAYNIIPSLIWGTNSPSAIVASSSYLSKATRMQPTNWLYSLGRKATAATSISMPPKRVLWVKILCALRGAVAGTVVLSNVIALTSLWQRARVDHAKRIQLGRERPMIRSRSNYWDPSSGSLDETGCTIRLAGVHSDVTELSLHRRGPERIWPVFEDVSAVQHLVSLYGCQDRDRQILPQVPVYWQINDGEYSKHSSWEGMDVPESWLYTIQEQNGQKRQLLYLEADATNGGESAVSLQKDSSIDISDGNKWNMSRSYQWLLKHHDRANVGKELESSTAYLDLDLKEVSQGFRRLADLARNNNGAQVEVMRVLLADPTVMIESGAGRKASVRQHVKELGLADVIVNARGLVLKSILEWLKVAYTKEDISKPQCHARTAVILETPSKAWFNSIQSELRDHGYKVIDRAQATMEDMNQIPMLVYERSSADTVHTIRQFLE